MADSMWQAKSVKIKPIWKKVGILGFLGPLISKLKSKFQDLKWQIQYGGLKL